MKNEFYISALVASVFAACSSEGDIVPKKDRFSRADAGIVEDSGAPRDPNANCIKPGTPRNERGIGGYCEPGRGDCDGPIAARFCTADYRELTPIEDNKWFCSAICTTQEECGSDALCVDAPGGTSKGCAPIVCYGDGGGGLAGR